MLNKKTAFTLVELCIAVIIIGILISVAIPTYTRQVERSKFQSARLALSSIRKANINYFYSNDSYSTDLTALGTTVGGFFTNQDGSWTYTVATGSGVFTITAQRRSGPFSASTIFILETGATGGWTGP